MKVAIAVGPARRFLVGDPDVQLIDVLAGRLIDELAAAEHHAEQRRRRARAVGACETLGDRVESTRDPGGRGSGRRCGVVSRLLVEVRGSAGAIARRASRRGRRRGMAASRRLRANAGRARRVPRRASIRLSGVRSVRAGSTTTRTTRRSRSSTTSSAGHRGSSTRYGGNRAPADARRQGRLPLRRLRVARSPTRTTRRARPRRRSRCATLEGTTAATEIQIGIAHGRLRSGTYGHEMRRTFVCLGDAVNLSARLMSKAPPGQIYVSEAVATRRPATASPGSSSPRWPSRARPSRSWPSALTGYARRTPARTPATGCRCSDGATSSSTSRARLEAALAGSGAVVGISAEAGMGKSRLVAEFVRSVRRRGHVVAFGECQAFGRNTSYFAWREIWRTLFHLRDDEPEEAQLARLEADLEQIDPELVARMPLLEPVVDLQIPDNDLTRAFDAKLRKTSLEGPAGDLPSVPGGAPSARPRARGLPLARRALARSAR